MPNYAFRKPLAFCLAFWIKVSHLSGPSILMPHRSAGVFPSTLPLIYICPSPWHSGLLLTTCSRPRSLLPLHQKGFFPPLKRSMRLMSGQRLPQGGFNFSLRYFSSSRRSSFENLSLGMRWTHTQTFLFEHFSIQHCILSWSLILLPSSPD